MWGKEVQSDNLKYFSCWKAAPYLELHNPLDPAQSDIKSEIRSIPTPPLNTQFLLILFIFSEWHPGGFLQHNAKKTLSSTLKAAPGFHQYLNGDTKTQGVFSLPTTQFSQST